MFGSSEFSELEQLPLLALKFRPLKYLPAFVLFCRKGARDCLERPRSGGLLLTPAPPEEIATAARAVRAFDEHFERRGPQGSYQNKIKFSAE
eukprot:6731660-Alexandrium_andersonii.AAC.1